MTRGFATRRNVRMESKVDSNRCHKKKHWQGRMAASPSGQRTRDGRASKDELPQLEQQPLAS